MSHFLEDPSKTRIDYLGSLPEAGPQPAFIYFSLSGTESLELHPYNQPAKLVADTSLRVFSFTLPGHEIGLNKFNAMQYWAERINKGEYILESFFEKIEKSIYWLVEQKIVDAEKIAIGGLSRGCLIAVHIAAKIKLIRTVLGFAPLTDLMQLKEFSQNTSLRKRADELNLVKYVDQLTHIHNLRFYIGNLDMRVSTDACYHFICNLAKKGKEMHARHQNVELRISQSIGYKGHGTSPLIFKEGAAWLKYVLIGS